MAFAASAETVEEQEKLLRDTHLLANIYPYVPRDSDYSIELGSMLEKSSLFYSGVNVGYNVGVCILTTSQTCQQYIDFIFGLGTREAETHFLYQLSVRWQYINFPKSWSPFYRLQLGGMFSKERNEAHHKWASGLGVGVTTYLHDKVDLRLELRGGYADHMYSQAMLGVQVKTDRLIEYFVLKLRDFGLFTVQSAIEATGAAVKATGEGIGTVIEGVASPFKKKKEAAPAESASEPQK